MSINLADSCQAFYFKQLNAHGVIVRLSSAWQELCLNRNYPKIWQKLLGEMAVVSVFFASQLKQNGRFGLQIRSSSLLDLLLIDCDNQLQLRGVIRKNNDNLSSVEQNLSSDDLSKLLQCLEADQASLSVIIDQQLGQPLYHSQVAFSGQSSSKIISNYISNSEQQDNFVLISSDQRQCAGFLLYKLPDQANNLPDDWSRVRHFAATLKPEELLNWPNVQLLNNLFAAELENEQEEIQLTSERIIKYFSPRDQRKVEEIVRNLGLQECQAIIEEHGKLTIDDDIGNHQYHFNAHDLKRIFT